MRKTKYILAIVTAAIGFTACEDVIDVDVPAGKTFTVVDAWLSDAPGKQSIRLTQTVPYTSPTPAPAVTNAVVTLTDLTDNSTYAFTFADGEYSHDPGAGNSIGKVGHAYKLRIALPNGIFEGIDTIRRNTTVDSLRLDYKTEEEATSGEEGYYARFYGRDLPGQVDYYWIRSYRQNITIKKEADVFAINAAFNEDISDGNQFITPISEGITEFDKPYQRGDTVIVRIASCTKASHTFLTNVETQLNNGGLFATILMNVRSNMVNIDPSSKEKILGWFGASSMHARAFFIPK